MKIYLVRHGQTDENDKGKLQGRINTSLNENGIRQAKRLREQLKDKSIDICITSPMKRTWETAMILVGDRVYIEEDARLIERDLGNFEGKNRREYDIKKYWDYQKNSSEGNVERIQDVISRNTDFLEDLKKRYPEKNVLIVSHATIIRVLDHLLKGTDLKKAKNLTALTIDNMFFKEYEVK